MKDTQLYIFLKRVHHLCEGIFNESVFFRSHLSVVRTWKVENSKSKEIALKKLFD